MKFENQNETFHNKTIIKSFAHKFTTTNREFMFVFKLGSQSGFETALIDDAVLN